MSGQQSRAMKSKKRPLYIALSCAGEVPVMAVLQLFYHKQGWKTIENH